MLNFAEQTGSGAVMLVWSFSHAAAFQEYIKFLVKGGRANDHTSLTAPLPVCSAKLSKLGLGQYYGGGPRWNP